MAQRTSIFTEFWLFLKQNKAYWMVPIILVLLLLIVLGTKGGIVGAGRALAGRMRRAKQKGVQA